MAISWAGTPIYDKGFIRLSRPSVSRIGVVVKVTRDVDITSKISRRDSLAVISSASVLILNIQNEKRILSLLILIKFITAVNISRKNMGFRPLRVYFIEIFDRTIRANVKIYSSKRPTYVFRLKINTLFIIINIIFTLGSILWRTEFPGIYCPMVILPNMAFPL